MILKKKIRKKISIPINFLKIWQRSLDQKHYIW
jgi:hypothetical protein